MGYINFNGYFGFGRQSTKGSGVAPSFFARYLTAKIIENNVMKDFREGGFGRQGKFAAKVGYDISAEVEAYLRADIGGWLATMMLGDDTVSGSSEPYLHTIVPGDSIQWWSFESSELGDSLVRRVIDAKANTLEISGAVDDFVKIKINVIGLDVDANISAATDSYSSEDIFKFAHGTFTTFGGVNEEISEFGISLNNNLETYKAGGLTAKQLEFKGLDVDISFKFKTTQDDEYRKVYYGSDSGTGPSTSAEVGEVVLTFNNGKSGTEEREFKITIPEVTYSALELPGLNADGELVTYAATGIATKSDSDPLIKFEVKSADANTYDGS